jgi:hypothetical protein
VLTFRSKRPKPNNPHAPSPGITHADRLLLATEICTPVPREIRNMIYTYLHRLWSDQYMIRAALDGSRHEIGRRRCIPACDINLEDGLENYWKEAYIHSKCASWFENKDLDPWHLEGNAGTQFASEQAEHYHETTTFRFVNDDIALMEKLLTRNRLGSYWRPTACNRSRLSCSSEAETESLQKSILAGAITMILAIHCD